MKYSIFALVLIIVLGVRCSLLNGNIEMPSTLSLFNIILSTPTPTPPTTTTTGFMYTGGTPLFNEMTGESTSRYEYLKEKFPDEPWKNIGEKI